MVASQGAHQDPPAAECSNNNAVIDLDPLVWQNFPPELHEKVQLCLPLCSLARLRCVCTAWNHTVFEEGFIRARGELLGPQKPWVVMTSTVNSISVYDSGKQMP